MKRKSSAFVAILLAFCFECFSQANDAGQTILQVYVGVDPYKDIFTTNYGDKYDGLKSFKINELSTSGAWGFKAEKMLSRRFGVGLDLWYAQTNVIATCTKKSYNPTSYNYSEDSAILSRDLKRLNTTLRFDLHFGRSPFFDPYVHFALGGAIYNYIFTSSNPDIHDESHFYPPISFKCGSGAKFWISRQISGFVEINIGGPIILGGIAYKLFPKVLLTDQRRY